MTSDVKRTVKLITKQTIMHEIPVAQEGFPMRRWSIQLVLIGSNGADVRANIFDKVTYKLHPTFANPNRTIKKPPFLLEEEGWGEFDMEVVLSLVDKAGDHVLRHDLNFQKERYESLHTISVPTNRPNLVQLLLESGPVPGYAGGSTLASGSIAENLPKRDKRKPDLDEKPKKKNKSDKPVDMDKLADGLQKLNEDDLLQVVQMVTDHKSSESYVVNDVEEGEFHLDLYTLPDNLLRMLADLVKKRGIE